MTPMTNAKTKQTVQERRQDSATPFGVISTIIIIIITICYCYCYYYYHCYYFNLYLITGTAISIHLLYSSLTFFFLLLIVGAAGTSPRVRVALPL